MTLKAVLFDMYGTIGIQSDYIPFRDHLRELGYARFIDDKIVDAFTTDVSDGEEHYEHSVSEATYDAWVRTLGTEALMKHGATFEEAHQVADIHYAWNNEFYKRMKPYPESRQVLDAVRAQGLTIAICSNWGWDIETSIDVMGIADDVDYVFHSGQLGVRKPHPAFFRHALETLAIDPADAIFVGDNWTADILGACAAGMRAIFVNRNGVEVTDKPDSVEIVTDLTGVLSHLN